MLARDARISVIVAEDDRPYREIEAGGHDRVSSGGYEEIGRAIVRRYVEAYDPGADLADYLVDGRVIVRLESDAIRASGYADAAYVWPWGQRNRRRTTRSRSTLRPRRLCPSSS